MSSPRQTGSTAQTALRGYVLARAHLIAAEIFMHTHAPTPRGPSRPGRNASLNALLIAAALLSAWVGLCAL